MRTMVLRSTVLLLLLALGLTLVGYGLAMRSTTHQFLTAENAFREDPKNTTAEWVDLDPSKVMKIAQDALGVDSLMELRGALVFYRRAQKPSEVSDYRYRSNADIDREIAKVKLSQISRLSTDIEAAIQAATLLGDLHAQDAMRLAEASDKKAIEAYDRAVEAFVFAIEADQTDTLNQGAKEDLEALIRFFMGGEGGEGRKEIPASGPRGGASDPGEGY